MSEEQTLSERSILLLQTLIQRYIREGQPVGSKTLAKDLHRRLSPASIRNVMADLEERGYLVSPHPSAGRKPTGKGYRLFVDTMLTVASAQSLDEKAVHVAMDMLSKEASVSTLVESASAVVCKLTNLASLVTLPKQDNPILKHIEFVPLSKNRVLVILVVDDQDVQNRIIHTDKVFTRSELQHAGNYLTHTFQGQALTTIRDQLLHSMQQDRKQMDDLMQSALALADQALHRKTEQSSPYVVSGQDKLLDIASESGIEKLKELFNIFSEKQKLLHLLDQSLQAEGLQIFIGEESGHPVLQDCTLVSMPYAANGKLVGVLGVIGPTRMPYQQVVSAIDITSKLLSKALTA